jgi:hypothetical protein
MLLQASSANCLPLCSTTFVLWPSPPCSAPKNTGSHRLHVLTCVWVLPWDPVTGDWRGKKKREAYVLTLPASCRLAHPLAVICIQPLLFLPMGSAAPHSWPFRVTAECLHPRLLHIFYDFPIFCPLSFRTILLLNSLKLPGFQHVIYFPLTPLLINQLIMVLKIITSTENCA